MRGHLAATGAGIVLRPRSREKSFQRRYAEHEAERAVAVVRINPVNPRPQEESHGGTNGFVPRAGNLEVDLVLAFQLNLAVVEPAREEHRAVNANQRIGIEALKLGGVKPCHSDARL